MLAGAERKLHANMAARLKTLISIIILTTLCSPVLAQQRQKFSIASFEQDPFDTSAQNPQYEKVDGSGARYAIVKVTSNNPDEDLKAFHFNFGNLKSIVEQHDDELWVYVQRNAKLVTITREGYTTINKYDLKTTIEAGKVYTMQLSTQARVVYNQMVQFTVSPTGTPAVIMVKSSKEGAVLELFGTTDETGGAAKSLPLGTYTYTVAAEGYHTSEGRFTLNDRSQTHKEVVALRSNTAEIVLQADTDVDIYVNGELKGRRQWRGKLQAGNYQVECRKKNYRASTQTISVNENVSRTFMLTPPTPITGTLAVTSTPLGASIDIDGKNYGLSPRNINDLLIGQHSVSLSKEGYQTVTDVYEVEENKITEANLSLNAVKKDIKGKSAEMKDARTVGVKAKGKGNLKSSCGYIAATFQAGSLMAVGGTVGAYLGNVNVEASYLKGLGKSEDIYWNYTGDGDQRPVVCTYQPTAIGFKLGYGLIMGTRLRLTPQAGLTIVQLKGGDSQCHVVSAAVGARADFALVSSVGLYVAPEIDFAAKKSDIYQQLMPLSSKIKGWGSGFNVRAGICLFF